MPQNPTTTLTDPDQWMQAKGASSAPAQSNAAPDDPDAWMQKQGQFLGDSTKKATIGPPKRTWYENLVGMLPSIPGAMAGSELGAAAGTAVMPGPGTAIGGFVGGIAGAGLGGWLGDFGYANPMSQVRRGVPNPPITAAKEAIEPAKRAMIGEAIGAPIAGVVGKVLSPFAKGITTRGAKVAERFADPAAPKSPVLPAEVSESRAALWLQNAGRKALIGGGQYKKAEEEASRVVSREANKELGKAGAPKLSPYLDNAGVQAERRLPATGKLWQATQATNADAERKAGSSLFDEAFDLADKVGIQSTRDTGKVAAASDALKPEFKQLGEMKKISKVIGETQQVDSGTPLMSAVETAMKEKRIGDTAAESIPSLEEFTKPHPVTESLSLRQLHQEKSELGNTAAMLRRSAAQDPNKYSAMAQEARKAWMDKKTQLNEFLTNASPVIAYKYNKAVQNWRNIRVKYNNPAVTQIANMTPDDIVPMLIQGDIKTTASKSGATMRSRQELVKTVLEAAPQAQKAVRSAVASKVMADAIDTKAGTISGVELKRILDTNGESLRPLLGADTYASWREFASLLAYKQRNREDIGRMFIEMRTPGAALGLATGSATPGNIALLGIPSMLAKIMTSNGPKTVKWLTTGIKMGPKSKAGIRATAQLGAWLANEAFNHDDPSEEDNTPNNSIPEPPK